MGPKLKAEKGATPISQDTLQEENANLGQVLVRAQQHFTLITDVQDALPRLPPQATEDRKTFRDGLENLRMKVRDVQENKSLYKSAPNKAYLLILNTEIDILEAQVSWHNWHGGIVTCADQSKTTLEYTYRRLQLGEFALYFLALLVAVIGNWPSKVEGS